MMSGCMGVQCHHQVPPQLQRRVSHVCPCSHMRLRHLEPCLCSCTMQASVRTASIRRSHPYGLAARQQPLQSQNKFARACSSASRTVQRRNPAMGSPEGSTLSSRTTAAALITAAAAAAAVAPSLSTSAATWSPVLTVAVLAAAATTLLMQYVLRSSTSSSSEGAQQPVTAAAYPEPSTLAALIKGRRSVFPRDFSGEPVPKAALEAMMSSATWAPTHKLTEPWHFVVLEGQSKLDFIALTRRLVAKNASPAKVEAQLAKLDRKAASDWTKVHCFIAICLKRHAAAIDEWEELAAVACAVQNLSLTATALGVAGYWSSWQAVARDDPEMLQFLGLSPEAGDKCLGVYVTGKLSPTWKCRPGSRKAWQEKVDWRH